MFTPKLH